MAVPGLAPEGAAALAVARDLLAFVKDTHNLKSDDEAVLKLAFEAGYRRAPSATASAAWTKADSVARYEHLIRQQHSLIVKLRQQVVELQTLQQSNPMLQIGTGHAFLSNSAPPAALINNAGGPSSTTTASSKGVLASDRIAQHIASRLPLKSNHPMQSSPQQPVDLAHQPPAGPAFLAPAASGLALDRIQPAEDTTRSHLKRDFDILLNNDSSLATSAPKRTKLAESATIPSIEAQNGAIAQSMYGVQPLRTGPPPPQLPAIGAVFSPMAPGPAPLTAAAVAAPTLPLPSLRTYPPGPVPVTSLVSSPAIAPPHPQPLAARSQGEMTPQLIPFQFDPSAYQQSAALRQRAQANRSPLTMTTVSAPQLTASAKVMAETLFGQQVIDLSSPVTSPTPAQ